MHQIHFKITFLNIINFLLKRMTIFIPLRYDFNRGKQLERYSYELKSKVKYIASFD